jgi:predicted XRE-type DNA-binding protein
MPATTTVRDTDLEAKLIASQAFAQTYAAFLECSVEIQEGIREMVLMLRDPNSTDDECRMAMATIAEALFPTGLDGHMGVDLETFEGIAPLQTQTEQSALDEQEAKFASRVDSLLKERKMTQVQLAEAIGVGQSAISMMLNRTCRPQRRTVERIATALNVDPASLWPDL